MAKLHVLCSKGIIYNSKLGATYWKEGNNKLCNVNVIFLQFSLFETPWSPLRYKNLSVFKMGEVVLMGWFKPHNGCKMSDRYHAIALLNNCSLMSI